MNKIASFFLHTVMAMMLTLAIGAGSAWAGPQYHVTVNTAGLAGQEGYLDFLFLGLDNAAPAVATLSSLKGGFDGTVYTDGEVAGSAASTVTIGNGGAWNEFALWGDFGGLLSFDVGFDVEGLLGAGTTLSVTLLDADFRYLGTNGDAVTFALQPGADVVVTAAPGLATVDTASAVPEPATAWLGAAGLLLMGGVRRRKSRH
jgi:hypothetical protein